jgi:hypothetical protein
LLRRLFQSWRGGLPGVRVTDPRTCVSTPRGGGTS